ncbi:hypothetical protein Vretimale_4292 [Volvox reticuliferus]|nr:hypothetical protein Vretimale_4292 [Volvox reticuliferus]
MGTLAIGPLFLAGHSRGGKLSVLAAAAFSAASTIPAGSPIWLPAEPVAVATGTDFQQQQEQEQQLSFVSGIILLDPADGSFEPQDPNQYPSALAALQNHPSLADVPVLIVGARRGGDCVPRAKNYEAFFKACRGQCTRVTLQDAGHLQFLDQSDSLQQSICAVGRGLSNSRVAAVSGRLAAAFIHKVAGGGPVMATAGPLPPAESGGSSKTGRRGVSCSSSNALERLYEEQLREAGVRYEVQVSGCSEGVKG